jgi:hypothetical protein
MATAAIPIDLRLRDIEREDVPAFQHHSRTDWGVMLWGGESPVTGFPLKPLEFQLPSASYDRAKAEQRAADLAHWHKRTHWIVREPLREEYAAKLDKGLRVYRRGGL